LAQFGSIWLNLDSAWIFLGCYASHIAADVIQSSPPAAPIRCAQSSSRARETGARQAPQSGLEGRSAPANSSIPFDRSGQAFEGAAYARSLVRIARALA
jgi:hypothetical protein